MGRGIHCTLVEKYSILGLKNYRKFIKKIVELMKCSKTKVFNAIYAKVKPDTKG